MKKLSSPLNGTLATGQVLHVSTDGQREISNPVNDTFSLSPNGVFRGLIDEKRGAVVVGKGAITSNYIATDINVTPKMIEAGVEELREKSFGLDLSEIVESVYLMMELERRSQGART